MKTFFKPAVVATRVFDDALLQASRQTTDAVADHVIADTFAERGTAGVGQLMAFLGQRKPAPPASPARPGTRTSRDQPAVPPTIQAAIAEAALAFDAPPGEDLPAAVHHFFATQGQLPAWADAAQMARGSAFFNQHFEQMMLLLGLYSLPYCYAAADGAQVLYFSERLRKDAYRRLLETGQFVLEVGKEGAFGPGGGAMMACQKVRLMHAAVRFFVGHSGQWNDAWGKPINQEDMAGTNLAMSYIPVRGLRKLNVRFEEADAEAFVHLWNVAGYLLGVELSLLPHNLREAYHLDRSIARRQFRPSEAGRALTKSLLDTLTSNLPTGLPSTLPATQMRLLLGDDLADLLALPRPDWTRGLLRVNQLANLLR